jgi:hypothetical protein
MTEEEWLAGSNWELMLRQIIHDVAQSPYRDRQLRRFACACACQVRGELSDERAEKALVFIEHALEQPSMRRELERASRLMGHVLAERLAGSPQGWP